MRAPFTLNDKKEDNARVKFLYNSPELHQNIEISLDGESVSVDEIMDAFQRFLSALGVCIPEDVIVGFVKNGEEDSAEESEDEDKEL